MNSAIIIILLFFSYNSATSENDDDTCRWLYRCCKKVRGQCVEVCEPVIICDETTTMQEETTMQQEEITTIQEELKSQEESLEPEGSGNHQVPTSFSMIVAPCRKGYLQQGLNGKCRKKLK